MVLVLLVVCGALGSSLAAGFHPAFCPTKTKDPLYISMQLPNAASLERTSEAARQVEQILADTPGVQYTTSVAGFSLLSFVSDQLQRFLLGQLEALG